MKIYYDISSFTKENSKSAVALGYFDGVHLGHQKVISALHEKTEDLTKTVLTFKDSPSLSFKKEIPNLLSNDDKIDHLKKCGADAVIFLNFDEIKNTEAETFVYDILINSLHTEMISCGYDYRFGKNAQGDTKLLKSICERENIRFFMSDPVICENEVISSTRIRQLISDGDITLANRMLGYNFYISGKVEQGLHNGSSFSYPTVNLPLSQNIQKPRFGVYRSKVYIGDDVYTGATNIGIHPTVKKVDPLCETYLLSYDGPPVYDRQIKVELLQFIRPEKKFDSKKDLINQIEKDVNTIMDADP